MSRDSNGASTSALRGHVLALAGTVRVLPTVLNTWTNFAAAHQGKVVLAKDAKLNSDSRVTHVVLVDSPKSHLQL